jgi:hypothetical protein
MELIGQLHALAALPAGNNCDIHLIESRVAQKKYGPFGEKKNLLSLPGFETRIFHPVA